jgi:hypothetical protein
MKNSDKSPSRFEHFGMAALLPGMQYMVERMENELNAMRETIRAAQIQSGLPPHPPPFAGSHTPTSRVARKIAKPKIVAAAAAKTPAELSPQAQYWARMTPKQRKAEMVKRGMVAANQRRSSEAKRTDPVGAKGRARQGVFMKSFWGKMTPEQRSAEMHRRRKVAAAKFSKAAALAAKAGKPQAVNGAAHV